MNSKSNLPASDDVARYLAEKGEAVIEQMQATVDRARELLATGEVAEPPDGVDPHRPAYPWEMTERRTDLPRRVWVGSLEDDATGEGLSVYFAAGFARSEDEFRRSIALELGRELAHHAQVGRGVEGLPLASVFLSDKLRSMLEAFDRGEDRPATMSFIVRYGANYS